MTDTSFSHWQDTAYRLNKFSFSTFFLARFTACGLLELHLIVLLHGSPCEFAVRPYFRTISRFSPICRMHFCIFLLLANRYYLYDSNSREPTLSYVAYVWASISFGYSPLTITLCVLRTQLTTNTYLSIWDIKLSSIKHYRLRRSHLKATGNPRISAIIL